MNDEEKHDKQPQSPPPAAPEDGLDPEPVFSEVPISDGVSMSVERPPEVEAISEAAPTPDPEVPGEDVDAEAEAALADPASGSPETSDSPEPDPEPEVSKRIATVFGPFLGEFGHEVRGWSPYIRAQIQANPGDNIVIFAYEGREPIYQEAIGAGAVFVPMALDFLQDLKVNPDCMGVIGPEKEAAYARSRQFLDNFMTRTYPGHQFDLVEPKDGMRYAMARAAEGVPIHFGLADPPEATKPVIIGIVARHRQEPNYVGRNYPTEKWEQVVRVINRRLGPEVAIRSIGADKVNRHIDGTQNCLTTMDNVRGVLEAMEKCHMVVGESSGGMHLALAAARPCVVFGESRVHQRYIKDNWFKAPLHFTEGLRPDPFVIGREVNRMIAGLRGVEKWRKRWE